MRKNDKLIDLNNKGINKLYACGDIHGEFLGFARDIIENAKLHDCGLIVCGDIGLGFYSYSKTEEFFQSMQTQFSQNNVYVIFFRGNHDDPKWFEYIDDTFATNYDNIYIAEDFTTVVLNDFKTLLWGGAVSVDRRYRSTNKSWWRGEEVVELPSDFRYCKDFNCICTHSAPDFCLPVIDAGVEYFINQDFLLKGDLEKERRIIGEGAYTLYSANKDTLKLWVYGHFHDTFINSWQMNEEISKFKTVKFIGLDMMRYTSDYISEFNNNNYNLYNRTTNNNYIELVSYA